MTQTPPGPATDDPWKPAPDPTQYVQRLRDRVRNLSEPLGADEANIFDDEAQNQIEDLNALARTFTTALESAVTLIRTLQELQP